MSQYSLSYHIGDNVSSIRIAQSVEHLPCKGSNPGLTAHFPHPATWRKYNKNAIDIR